MEYQELKENLDAVRQNRGGYKESFENILEEYFLCKQVENPDIYFFRYRFGEGKSTFGLSQLTIGDLFISPTQKQSKENKQHFEKIHPERDTFQIYGWNYIIGMIDEDKEKHLTERIKYLWDEEAEERKELETLTKKEDTPRQAILEYRERYDEEPELLERYLKQFREETWRENVIFACPSRMELLEQRAFLSSMDRVMTDEGIEEEFVERTFGELSEELTAIGVKNPQKRQIDMEDYSNRQVEFEDYEPESSLKQEKINSLQAMARKILINLYVNSYEVETIKGKGLTDHTLFAGGEIETTTPHTEYLVEKFSNLWLNVAKKNFNGSTLLGREKHKLMNEGELDKLKRLERMERVFDKIFLSRFCRLEFKKTNGLIEEMKLEKPLYYELWDISEKADQELWVLDATTGKEYYSYLKKKYRYEANNHDTDIDEEYLGDGNNFAGVEFEDRSYEALDVDELEPEYEWYLWDWNVEDERATVTMNSAESKVMKEIIKEIKKEAEKKKVGIVSYKYVKRQFEDSPVIADNFAQSEGSNEFKDVDHLYIIGSPPKAGLLEDYVRQYRELPAFNPMNNEEMRRVSPYGGLAGFRDVISVEKKAENVDSVLQQLHSGKMEVDSGTMWSDFYNRNIERPVFDRYFRKRYQFEVGGKVTRMGFNAMRFLNEPNGTVGDWLYERKSDEEIIENWGDMPKKVYQNKPYVDTHGNLKKWARKWKSEDFEDVPESTYYDWKEKWEEVGISIPK